MLTLTPPAGAAGGFPQESEDSSGSGGPATRTPDDGTSAAHMPETARGDVGETSDTKDMTPGTGTAGNTGDSDGGGTTPAPGAVLLEGSYDKELSAIRAQVRQVDYEGWIMCVTRRKM